MTKPNIPGIITEAKRFERERIIKLLQDQAVLCGKGSREHALRCALRIVGDGCNCDEVIALIKGENK